MQLNTVVPCIFSRLTQKHSLSRFKYDISNHSTSRRYFVHTQASPTSCYSWIFTRKCRFKRVGLEQYGFHWRRLEKLQVGRSQSFKMCFPSSQPFRSITVESKSQASRSLQCDIDRYRFGKMHTRSNQLSWSKRPTCNPTAGSCQSGGFQ